MVLAYEKDRAMVRSVIGDKRNLNNTSHCLNYWHTHGYTYSKEIPHVLFSWPVHVHRGRLTWLHCKYNLGSGTLVWLSKVHSNIMI